MQTPSEAKTKIIPIKNPRMLVKVRPLLNGCIRFTWHTSYKRPAVEAAMLKPLEHAIATYFKMMRELYRSEHEFARREADNLNLTKALQDVARGGVAVVAPDETDEEVSRCGVQGVAYVHGRCEPGYLVREDGQNFWMIPERETFVRITEPTLMFFLEEKPSYANTIRSQNQDHPN